MSRRGGWAALLRTVASASFVACAPAAVPGTGAPTVAAAFVEAAADEHEWYLPLPGRCNLYVRELGEGPLVVVLHDGWGFEHSSLVDGFRRLAGRNRFVFYDQRGSLRSPCDNPADIDGHVADLERLRSALGEERLSLVGHGMGGYLAMRYAAAHPERVAGLSLVASLPARGADVRSPTGEDLRARFQRPAAQEEFRRNGIDTEASPTEPRARYVEHRIAKGAVYLHDVTRWRSLRGTMFYSSSASRAAGMPPEDEDLTPALAALEVPLTVIFPEDDYNPVEPSTRWVAAVPRAELVIVPNAGHVLWVDQPEAFARLLGTHLDRVAHARAAEPPLY